MSAKKKHAPEHEPETPSAETWTPEELVAVAHLGPAIIGRAMYDAAQAYVRANGKAGLGPATRGE